MSAVADVYEALTSNRPYRRALPAIEAFELIEKGEGSGWNGSFSNAGSKRSQRAERSAGRGAVRSRDPRALQQRFARRGAQDATFDERRQFARFAFLSKTLLEVATSFKCVERPREHFTIVTTDVSRDGVAFLHVEQLYPGELVTVWFPTCKVACRVTRCLKHNAKCYEIGASFEAGPRPQSWIRDRRPAGDLSSRSARSVS